MAREKSLTMMSVVIISVLVHYSDALKIKTCNSCSSHCSGVNLNSTLCKCDADCQLYNDCCSSFQTEPLCHPLQLHPTLPPSGTKLDCQSAYINPNITITRKNEAFYMITSCPDNLHNTDVNQIKNHCTEPESTYLAPVTDARTGLVYRNQYCAHCNAASQLIPWQTTLACNSSFYELVRKETLATVLQDDPNILQRECTECLFVPPPELTPARSCIPAVKTCLPYSSQLRLSLQDYEAYAQFCQSEALDPVEGQMSDKVYHNTGCAICNGERYECLYAVDEDFNKIKQKCLPSDIHASLGPEIVVPFSITLSSLGKDKVTVSSDLGGRVTLPVSCPEGHISVSLQCRPTVCPEGYAITDGACARSPTCTNTTIILSNTSFVDLGNNSIQLKYDNSIVEVLDYDALGRPIICAPTVREIINCSTALVALNDSEYTTPNNDSILFQNVTLQISFYDEFNRPLVCPDLLPSENSSTAAGLLSNLPGILQLTYSGCTLSVIGTLGLLLTYLLFKELRTYPSLVLMNLCAAVLGTSLVFPIGNTVVKRYPLVEICSTIAILLHYFYLVQFAWMSIFSYEVMRTFYQARKLVQKSKEKEHKLLVIYLVTAWLFLPGVIMAPSIILNYTTDTSIQYGEDSSGRLICWINQIDALIASFAVPLGLSLSCNLITFIITSILLYKAHRESKMMKSKSLTLLRVWLAAFLISGLSWIFGFLAIPAATYWMWYPFTIFNSTQGFGIAVVFLSTKKVLRLYKQLFKGHKSKTFPSSKTSTLTLQLSESHIDKVSCESQRRPESSSFKFHK